MRVCFPIAGLLGLTLAPALPAADVPETEVRLTGRVLVPDCPRLGVHLCGDNPYESPVLKQRVAENFEGTFYRFLTGLGTRVEADRAVIGYHPDPLLTRMLKGASYTILSGPDAWRTGRLAGVETVETPGPDGRVSRSLKYLLDRPFRPHPRENNLLLEVDRRDDGFNPFLRKARSWADPEVPEIEERLCSSKNGPVPGDPPPGSTGRTVFRISGKERPGHVMFPAAYESAMTLEGTWRAAFWAKAASGTPTITFGLAGSNGRFLPAPKPESFQPADWRRIEHDFAVPPGQKIGILHLRIEVTGGEALIDDVELAVQGDRNPTAFRDAFVDLLRELQPGVTRYLLNTSGTLESRIPPPLGQYACGIGFPGGRVDWGIHQYFELAEYLGHDPWYTLPGTLTREEVAQFLEYLAAPPDVGWGQVRARLGHPKPWTETLHRIFLQFGNEVITFAARGYPGPDYWKGLIEAGKRSPYYRGNIVFIVDRQTGAAHVLENAPNADQLCLNSYMMYALRREMLEPLDTPEKRARYVVSVPFQMWLQEASFVEDVNLARSRGKEVSVYEGGNFHTTFGDAPVETINDVLTGLAGGLACIADMLVPLKAYGVRVQNAFNLSQFSFSPGGSFGDIKGRVRLWGGVLERGGKGRRFRPRMLMLMACNRVMGGDLVETIHGGADPSFDVSGTFTSKYGHIKNPRRDEVKGLKAVQSFGFARGRSRGLILLNLDPVAAQTVAVFFEGKAVGGRARSWLVSGPDPFADNEPEREEPQVTLKEETVDPFAAGARLLLPPCALRAVQWDLE